MRKNQSSHGFIKVKFRILQIFVRKIVLQLLLKCWVEFNTENGSKWIASYFKMTSKIILSICGHVAGRKWVVRHKITNVGVLRYTIFSPTTLSRNFSKVIGPDAQFLYHLHLVWR